MMLLLSLCLANHIPGNILLVKLGSQVNWPSSVDIRTLLWLQNSTPVVFSSAAVLSKVSPNRPTRGSSQETEMSGQEISGHWLPPQMLLQFSFLETNFISTRGQSARLAQ
ncbi:hypothetical protein RchiOBHm_Chr4g0395241 [Rosa chinensis]|uniref:Uncharacterized protein n=1 Tax=Rosa chinensis TaxID=74649 RepID=A0A2P6QRF5_ROSCH|nr:hypothetical protein RchiOBHm_Chr4g0395241 [Rosa chinensis]